MRILITFCLLTVCFSLFGQDMPDWVRERPVSSVFYTGIGRALKTDPDYMQTAKQNALKDLASELKVQVSANSLLQTLEGGDGNIGSRFEETVRVIACGELEKFRLAGTWQDDKEYWVYYELSVIDYEEYLEKRKREAVSRGYDCWKKGNTALEEGGLMTALEFWVRGLEIVQPVINEELTCDHQGVQIDVAAELYGAVKNVFTGMVLTVDTSSLEVRAFQGVERPLMLTLSRNGRPLRNVALKAGFLTGDGHLSPDIRTDVQGKAGLYIGNVTSSLPHQQIKAEVDAGDFRTLTQSLFGGLIREVLTSVPRVVVNLHVAADNMRVCIRTENGADASIVRAVKDILTRHRFMVVGDPLAADTEVSISGNCRKGEKRRSGVSAVVPWHASVGVKLSKRDGNVVLLDYQPDEVQVLQAESVPEDAARRNAVNELVKRLNRQLPERLKEVYQ